MTEILLFDAVVNAIKRSRQLGQTSELVLAAQRSNGIIVVANETERRRILHQYKLPIETVKTLEGLKRSAGTPIRPLYFDNHVVAELLYLANKFVDRMNKSEDTVGRMRIFYEELIRELISKNQELNDRVRQLEEELSKANEKLSSQNMGKTDEIDEEV